MFLPQMIQTYPNAAVSGTSITSIGSFPGNPRPWALGTLTIQSKLLFEELEMLL